MKSTEEQLKARGFVPDEAVLNYQNISDDELINLLNSDQAAERTLGAKLSMGRSSERLLPLLCELLENEDKLYTKLALSEAIAAYGVLSLKYLLPLLGKIGNNQHKKAALVDLNKKSSPLPRDLSARIVIRIGESALPFLEEILVTGTYAQKCEAIDAIGHIAFNVNKYQSEESLHVLLGEQINDELIVWKIIRAFQAFPSKKVEQQLNYMIEKSENEVLKEEAKRSLRQIQKRRVRNF